jgi:hypothetical protein
VAVEPQERFDVSERRACLAVDQSRSSQRYEVALKVDRSITSEDVIDTLASCSRCGRPRAHPQ